MRRVAARARARRGMIRAGRLALLGLAALAHAGCSSGMESLGQAQAPLAYQHSNAFVNAGYSESLLAPNRYRIEVKGPLDTPRDRLEKMAATRAAEIGRDNRLGFFKIDEVRHTTHCDTYTPGARAPAGAAGSRKIGYAKTTADVTYVKATQDPGYRDAKRSFDQLRAELDQPQAATAAGAGVGQGAPVPALGAAPTAESAAAGTCR